MAYSKVFQSDSITWAHGDSDDCSQLSLLNPISHSAGTNLQLIGEFMEPGRKESNRIDFARHLMNYRALPCC